MKAVIKDGKLFTEEGEEIKIGDEVLEISMDGYTPKEKFDKAISKIHKEKKELEKKVIRYEEAGLEEEVEKLRKKEVLLAEELETAKEDARAAADADVQAQMEKSNSERDEAIKARTTLERRVERDDIDRLITAAAIEHKFRDPADAVYRLSGLAHREALKDKEGKATGTIETTFPMNVPGDDGVTKEKHLSAHDAVGLLGHNKPHYIEGSAAGGPPATDQFGKPSGLGVKSRKEFYDLSDNERSVRLNRTEGGIKALEKLPKVAV